MVMERMETESHGHVKRKSTSHEEGKNNGKKARKQFDRTGKNSLQVLNHEFNQSTQPIHFQFEEIGGSGNNPSYKALAELEGVWFEAVGTSKMMAKRLLASKALAQLRSIFISPDYPDKESVGADITEKKLIPETEKNPLQVLHQEFNQGKPLDIQFDIVDSAQKTPVHRAVAEIKGISFEGVGTSKIIAKRDLAIKALARLKNKPLMVQNTSGNLDVYNPFDISKAPLPPDAISKLSATSLQVFQVGKKRKVDKEKAQHSPLMVLSETYPDIDLDWADELGKGGHKYKVEAVVDGVTFFGEGRSKKVAKTELAKSVLKCLHDVTDFKEIEDESEKAKPEKSKKKFVVNQLKEIAGEDVTIETVRQEGAEKDSAYRVTIVAKGTAFEAVASNKFGAKIKAAKKALEALQPRKVVDPNVVDVNRHPNMAFHQHFKDVRINDSENIKEDGSHEHSLETTIQGRKFRTTAANKKKAKLQLVLKVFEGLKHIPPTRWTAIDLNEVNGK